MHYKPCVWCPIKKTCTEKFMLAELVKVMNLQEGIKINGLKFSCAKRQALFTPGMRVQVTLTEWFMEEERDYVEYGYYQMISVPREGDVKTINGTVMMWRGDKVQIWLDEPIAFHERQNVRVKIKPNKLTVLNEAPREVCDLCGRPEGKQNEELWYCEECMVAPELTNRSA